MSTNRHILTKLCVRDFKRTMPAKAWSWKMQLYIFNPFNGFHRILVISECREPEIAFPARSEA